MIILPARIEAEQTVSSVSDNPDNIGVTILERYGWNLVPKVAGRYTNSDMNPSRTELRGDCAFDMISGINESSRSIPNPASTSLKPYQGIEPLPTVPLEFRELWQQQRELLAQCLRELRALEGVNKKDKARSLLSQSKKPGFQRSESLSVSHLRCIP